MSTFDLTDTVKSLGDFFLKYCFWNFPSKYTNGNPQFWPEKRGHLGKAIFPLTTFEVRSIFWAVVPLGIHTGDIVEPFHFLPAGFETLNSFGHS